MLVSHHQVEEWVCRSALEAFYGVVHVVVPVDVNFIQFITNWLLTLFFGTFHILVNDAKYAKKLRSFTSCVS